MRRPAYTLIELLATIVVVLILGAILLPLLGTVPKRSSIGMKNSSLLRGQHQGMVVYAQSNNGYLPGMDADGELIRAGLETTGSPTNDGSVAGSRYWMLLNGSFISPAFLLNSQDKLSIWTTGQVTTGNHSHAMLRITQTWDDYGRREEWRDNANGAAVLISDRNISSDSTDAHAQSLWTTTPGDWRGGVCWGDNHVGFELSNRLTTTTIYDTVKQTNDNLFATLGSSGVTDNSKDAGANAFMTTTN
ncbi:MAG: type II secretion system protein [Planctomycetota bacterium]|nr:type II secretion system protein [Planctomycetota bacterium]